MNLVPYLAGDIVPLRKNAMKIGEVLLRLEGSIGRGRVNAHHLLLVIFTKGRE